MGKKNTLDYKTVKKLCNHIRNMDSELWNVAATTSCATISGLRERLVISTLNMEELMIKERLDKSVDKWSFLKSTNLVQGVESGNIVLASGYRGEST